MTVSELIRELQKIPQSQSNFPVLLWIGGKWKSLDSISIDIEIKTVDLVGDDGT